MTPRIRQIEVGELKRCDRAVDMIVIHCSATREDRRYVLSQLDRDHRARGFDGIGYHFYIDIKGKIFATRDMEVAGAHTKGYNYRSIGICYEGGLDSQERPKDTRTEAQRESMRQLVDRLCDLHGKVRIAGHRELNPHKACPCFDAKAEFDFLFSQKEVSHEGQRSTQLG
ncbi:N-acetylmuramoyl-L-alanine amidase [Porphyromonas sp.]|uniref:N-acetylmuramoyl-L-alanine amidase n=1 Tax=Porphyromonas sp. TaxID=1924944 RepID=UPI0026DC5B56|nr:N-acetylmuramoyl-L-alanine amidase [Porphyromonas sp.]MDO4770428.1 N-acetylmuramoyl-L-alanine amidase [Porphyromonas sp.]